MMKYFLGCVTACAILAGVGYATSLTTTATASPAFRVTCGTTATPMHTASLPNYRTVRCGTPSNGNTAIYIGDQNVTTSNGYAICGHTSCIEQQITLNTNLAFCVVASDTEELSCIGLR